MFWHYQYIIYLTYNKAVKAILRFSYLKKFAKNDILPDEVFLFGKTPFNIQC